MATLQDKINALEAKIERYEQEYANASSEDKRLLLAAITAKETRLTALLQQQLQAGGGQGGGGDRVQAYPSHDTILAARKSIFWMSMEDARGNCVAISNKLALCSLHAKVKLGIVVCVRTTKGEELPAKVVFNSYEDNKLDISVLELDSPYNFNNFLIIHRNKIEELDNIFVIGMKLQDDVAENFSARGEVNTIRHEGAIFEANYSGCAGLSGAPVVTIVEDNELRVVGVHVGIHGDSAEDSDEGSMNSEQGSQVATRRQLSDGLTTLSQRSHGRSTYAMICDVRRVPRLLNFLDKYDQVDIGLSSKKGKLKVVKKMTVVKKNSVKVAAGKKKSVAK